MNKIICFWNFIKSSLQFRALCLPAALLLMMCMSCSKTEMQVKSLDANQWAPYTRSAINRLLNEEGNGSDTYNPLEKPYAVFDFDNTTIINDIEEATFVYQIENLLYRVTPEKLKEVLETGIPDVNAYFAEGYENASGKRITTAMLADDITADYRDMADISGVSLPLTTSSPQELSAVHMTDAYLDFRAKLRFLYDAVNATFDSSVGYPWVLYQFAGFTRAEVETIALASLEYWMNYGSFTKLTWTSPSGRPGSAGIVSVSYKTGLAIPQEMKDLYQKLRANGIDVYICSASLKEVVQAVASNPKYGLDVPLENVYAMMLQSKKNGDRDEFINAYDNSYFMTYAAGKVKTIDRFIAPLHGGRGPILVAGDSAGDYEMISSYDDTRLGLIVNRVRKDAMLGLSREAAATIGTPTARYLLQGRDENAGTFRASEKSILLGKSIEELCN